MKPEINQLIEKLSSTYNRKASSVLSHARGHLGELMTTLLYDESIRHEVIVDNTTFDTPIGKRRLDNFHPASKIAVEAKNTRVVARQSIRQQILKDQYLLELNLYSRITWVLFRGASKRVHSFIYNTDIEIIDMFDQYFEEAMKQKSLCKKLIIC